ncbi:fructosamine kinase family protein [Liquorilactobacillus sicerae]|uniref:fructosamine kinase family protein n=1 Tax=Liquorilactobacillus sicerae TaxID=1416943 RepID=UPI00248057AD|nr:fructosamine kinase family protein [Liquorilactobacillus sicerae]
MDQKWLAQLPIEKIITWQPVGGGDVNQAFHLQTAQQDFFLLVQSKTDASFYQGEIAGLKDFQFARIKAPRVIANGQINGDAYLLLDYLSLTRSGDQRLLGKQVARLHQVASPNGKFGYQFPYAGTSISFANTWTDNWSDLFLKQRLDRLAQHLQKKSFWHQPQIQLYQRARQVIAAELAVHQSQPVLLHGDFWAGNFAFSADGQPVLIDPAVLYGDREFDIGITTVFGGFTPDFYQAYQHDLPLTKGYQQRLNFYRLYYLMVHLDKFGLSYAASVMNLLTAIIKNC